jgi:DNA-binding NtrC family response regulator
MAHILIVDDEKKMRHLLSIMLSRKGYKVDQAGDGKEALNMIRDIPYDMVITDIKMPHMDGIELLKKIKEMEILCPVVFITAFATVDSAVEAMRHGALDYITKPFEEDRILLTVERTLGLSKIMAENIELKRELRNVADTDEMVYISREMASAVSLGLMVAKTDTAVIITGESGTGKELMARFVHHKSHRKGSRFVPVNCAAISPSLVESELFGHERGSFTGADRRSIGKFEFAKGGTLFLDEVGDLPIEAQAKFLRALQEKKIQRVGGNDEIPVDVRVICATNRDLNELADKETFRRDLFFRITGFPIHMPLLRERTDDVIPLACHFLDRYKGSVAIQLTDGAKRLLREYPWPGNVRELANAMERAVILAGDKGFITAEVLSFLRSDAPASPESTGLCLSPSGISLEELEKDLVKQALEASNNNQMAAARLLGLTRAKFRVLMRRLENEG